MVWGGVLRVLGLKRFSVLGCFGFEFGAFGLEVII